jgi:hypothetical protein
MCDAAIADSDEPVETQRNEMDNIAATDVTGVADNGREGEDPIGLDNYPGIIQCSSDSSSND